MTAARIEDGPAHREVAGSLGVTRMECRPPCISAQPVRFITPLPHRTGMRRDGKQAGPAIGRPQSGMDGGVRPCGDRFRRSSLQRAVEIRRRDAGNSGYIHRRRRAEHKGVARDHERPDRAFRPRQVSRLRRRQWTAREQVGAMIEHCDEERSLLGIGGDADNRPCCDGIRAINRADRPQQAGTRGCRNRDGSGSSPGCAQTAQPSAASSSGNGCFIISATRWAMRSRSSRRSQIWSMAP